MSELEINPVCRQLLSAGVKEMGLDISLEQQESLLGFVALLHRWNRAFNLTAVRDPSDMITRHLLDSLVVSPYLKGSSILDVGTGPGLPGIPLAITQPHREFTLLDSNGKKIRFVRQAGLELGLQNVQAEQVRAEAYDPPQLFETIVTRAFASLPDILEMTRRLLMPGGRLLALKGRWPEAELAAANLDDAAVKVVSLRIPQLEGERHAVLIDF